MVDVEGYLVVAWVTSRFSFNIFFVKTNDASVVARKLVTVISVTIVTRTRFFNTTSFKVLANLVRCSPVSILHVDNLFICL